MSIKGTLNEAPKKPKGFQKGHPVYTTKGDFKPGHTPWDKGMKGVCLNSGRTHFKKGFTPWNKGKKTGVIPWNKGTKGLACFVATGKKTNQKMKELGYPNRVGKTQSLETKKQISATKLGIPLDKWEKFVMPEMHAIRESGEYVQWRKKVFERDNFTCQLCKQHGGKLHVDHIKPFAKYPNLRFDVNNGRVLCIDCHRQTDTYGGRSK